MKSSGRRGWLAGVAAAMIAATGGEARADGTGEGASASGEVGASAEADEHAEGQEREHHEDKGGLGLDLVLGGGKVPFAAEQQPSASNPAVTYSRADGVSSNVQSFIAGGRLEVAEHVAVAVRVPFTFAGFSPDGSASRSTASFGNVELEGEYGLHLGKGLKLVGALGITVPTANGTEIPAGLANQNAQFADVTGYDRYSLSRAAASARGFEDNALFEPQRFGIIPKVSLRYRMHALSIEPYVKVENLIGTSSSLAQSYVGDFVGGLRVGYWVQRQFEVAVRGWVSVGFAGGDEDKKTALAFEPQLVLRFGPIRPYAGVILPAAGPPSENGFVGVRVGVAGTF